MLNKPLYNFHTHTYRSKHGEGDIFDYCQSAIHAGLENIGFSEHTPLPQDQFLDWRMGLSELAGYVAAIEKADNHFDSLRVLKGMECDYLPDLGSVNFYQEILLDKYQLDYLIGAVHLFPTDGELLPVYGGTTSIKRISDYAQFFIKAMESGIFSFMAHPELFRNSFLIWDKNVESCMREIFEAAKELNMPLELNTAGFTKPAVEPSNKKVICYPSYEFWELAAEYDISAVINSDAHKPEDINSYLSEGMSLAIKCGLKIMSSEEIMSHFEGVCSKNVILKC